MKYVVLQRFGKSYITFIMILEDEFKAQALADFLNEGQYFETVVTVETADKQLPNDKIIELLARTI